MEDTGAGGLCVDGFRVRTLTGLTLTRLVVGAVGLEGARDVPRDEKAMKGFMVGLFAPCESTLVIGSGWVLEGARRGFEDIGGT